MITLPFTIGLIGAITLVMGAAYPIRSFSHPVRSAKNWLFAIGGLLMLIYSILNYLQGGAIFFIFLQGLVNVASIFMLSNVSERISTPMIIGMTLVLISWSLVILKDLSTLFFIIGLGGIASGYVLKPGTARRNMALTFGSLLIAIFSALVGDWIFLGLNSFFALFSAYYSWKLSADTKPST